MIVLLFIFGMVFCSGFGVPWIDHIPHNLGFET